MILTVDHVNSVIFIAVFVYCGFDYSSLSKMRFMAVVHYEMYFDFLFHFYCDSAYLTVVHVNSYFDNKLT